MSAVYQLSVSRISAVCQPYVRRMSAIYQPYISRMLAVYRPYVSRGTAVCQPYIRRMSAIPNLPICQLRMKGHSTYLYCRDVTLLAAMEYYGSNGSNGVHLTTLNEKILKSSALIMIHVFMWLIGKEMGGVDCVRLLKNNADS